MRIPSPGKIPICGVVSPLLQMEGQLRASQVEIKNRNLAIAALQAKINQY